PEFKQARILDATSELLRRMLPSGTAIVVDDAHLLDQASISLIERIAAETERESWLLVVARRPVLALGLPACCQRIDLHPLDQQASVQLVMNRLAQRPTSDAEIAAVVRRAGGNPLFLV